MKRLRRFIGAGLMTCLMLTGCGQSIDTENIQDVENGDSIEIGMSFDSFVIERWQKDRDVFVSTASALGASVNVQNASGDVDKQIEQIRYLIDRDVDCLVIIPIDSGALSEVVKEAKEKDIPIVSYDRLINQGDTDLYISFDNKSVGQMMARALIDAGATKVVKICGPTTDSNVAAVDEGFDDLVESANIQVLDTYHCDGWKAELGGAYVYDNIETIREADGIMCGNDDVAASVIRALAVSQLAGVIPVVGQDADLIACQHIVEGTQTMTVYKPVGKLAEQAAQLSVALAKGEKLDIDNTIYDGLNDVPYVAVEPIVVNRNNIDSVVIEGGYHAREDVYLNVGETQQDVENTELLPEE
ncbi:MAG: substrate-binding domain-containing protein [Pseudobutyrivibrio sp.]|nr:substrate-binding domain-containing protein [Pseudobutyrivibrio sp.]